MQLAAMSSVPPLFPAPPMRAASCGQRALGARRAWGRWAPHRKWLVPLRPHGGELFSLVQQNSHRAARAEDGLSPARWQLVSGSCCSPGLPGAEPGWGCADALLAQPPLRCSLPCVCRGGGGGGGADCLALVIKQHILWPLARAGWISPFHQPCQVPVFIKQDESGSSASWQRWAHFK